MRNFDDKKFIPTLINESMKGGKVAKKAVLETIKVEGSRFIREIYKGLRPALARNGMIIQTHKRKNEFVVPSKKLFMSKVKPRAAELTHSRIGRLVRK